MLISAGIKRAKGIVCAVNSDSDNIVITLGARELKPDINVFARVDEAGATRKIRRAGATHIVSPFRTGAVNIANAITHPNLSSFLHGSRLGDGAFELSEATVSGTSQITGESLGEIRARTEEALIFVALQRRDDSVCVGPDDDEVLREGDLIVVAGSAVGVQCICDLIGATDSTGFNRAGYELSSWQPRSPVG